MNNKTVAIIITVAACLLCLCPGVTGFLMGILFTVISIFPGAEIDVLGSADPKSAQSFGVTSIIVGAIFVIIAIVVIILAWRKKKYA
jgi:heme/copper-type cytochrome/quinol oxidase subunit 2